MKLTPEQISQLPTIEDVILYYADLTDDFEDNGHLPDKHKIESRGLLSWAKYQRKKIKEGTLDAEKREMFEALLATHSIEHTGGRRKKTTMNNI